MNHLVRILIAKMDYLIKYSHLCFSVCLNTGIIKYIVKSLSMNNQTIFCNEMLIIKFIKYIEHCCSLSIYIVPKYV